MVIFTIIMTDMNEGDALGIGGFSEFVCFVCLYLEEKRAGLADSSPPCVLALLFWLFLDGICLYLELS